MKSDYAVQAGPLGKLRRRWWAVAFLYAVSLSAGYALLRVTWQPTYAWRWAALAGLGLVYMSFTSVLLWPLFSPPVTTLAGVVFTLPFLAGFTEDWLEVSGQIGPASHRYWAAKRLATVVRMVWLPVLLRLVLVAVMLGSAIAGPGSAWPPWPGNIFGLAVGVAAVMLVLGAAGWLAALGLLVAACSAILTHGLDVLNGLMLVCTIALMLLGSGAYSVWRPEDALLNRRAREKKVI